MKLIYSKKGLANSYFDHIEINEKLKANKPLRDYVIKHELGHSMDFDLGYEVSQGLGLLKNPKMAKMLIGFYIKNPSTWTDFLPIQISNKKVVYDLNLLILYVFAVIFAFVIFKIVLN